MHIEVLTERCEGHARCIESAPEVFGYDDVTNRAFVLDTADPEAHHKDLLEAVEGCPERAMRLTEGATG